MSQQVYAEVIAIGTEILLGEITDTNSVYIAQMLRGIGINLYFMTSVGDNERRIADAIRIALGRADVVITCGGLGPTIDDMTRQAVALATDRELAFHQTLLDQIAKRFETFRVRMSENNRRQAYLPENATVIENPVGTAPSFIVEHSGKLVISLPGVPREMKYLMENAVIPELRRRYGLGIIKARVLKTAGIGESMLDEAIGRELLEMSNPTVGLAAHSGQVDVRVTAKAESEPEADAMIALVEAQVRAKVGAYIFGVNGDTLEAALAEALARRGMTLAILEAGLPPSVSKRMERVTQPGQLARVERVESPASVAGLLGIDTLENLRELAEDAAQTLANDGQTVGIAVLAVADRAEDRADSDTGSAFAVCVNGQMRSRSYGFGGMSEDAVRWSGTWAMAMAWQMLSE
ncbi:MAG: CinA family nicotinamide mononucleotide deamidase-related protein [Chloroflexota bacterium]|nr:CinA family nicotinamide mononucleotide deamidase-related protein [Chloroflexota bacterium]